MQPTPTTIIGAGLSGLLAAHAWPTAPIIEAAPEPNESHKALLRFRSDVVSRLTGIEFRKVRVRKGIFYSPTGRWADGQLVGPDIKMANLYSRKVLGVGRDRSIWDLAPVDRFIAPENFYAQLLDAVGHRVHWGTPFDFSQLREQENYISTMPMPAVMKMTSTGLSLDLRFNRKAIVVLRFRIPDCDVYQTVYFPNPEISLYRVSVTGDLLICEHMADDPEAVDGSLGWVEEAFGLDIASISPLPPTIQRYGKIEPIDDSARKQLLFDLTHRYQIYSLGRFAIWKNVLLDDVANDIDVIKRLMRAGTAYDKKRGML